MAGYRSSGPTLKSVRKNRVTTIRDIIKEIEADDARSRACYITTGDHDGCRVDEDSRSESNTSKDSGIVSESDTQMSGPRQIVVRVPSVPVSKTKKKRETIKFDSDVKTQGEIEGATTGFKDKESSLHSNRTGCMSNRNIGTKTRKSVSMCEGISKQDNPQHHRDQRSLSQGHVLGDTVNNTSSQDRTTADDNWHSNRHESVTTVPGVSRDPQSLSEIEDWESLAFGMDGIHFLPKVMTDRGSCAFHNVMDEMKQEIKKKKQRREGFKSAIKMSMIFKGLGDKRAREREEGLETDSGSDVSDDEISDDDDTSGKSRSFRSMSRGWKLLNMVMKEQHLERKKSESPEGWNLLTRTISHMTNEEKARQELYERYIYKPNSWAEGLVNYPKFLRERQYSAKLSRTGPAVKTRPITAHPNAHNMTSGQRPGSGRHVPTPNSSKQIRSNTKAILKRPKSGPL